MVTNAIAYAKQYHVCKIHADYIHRPSEYLYRMVALWPFKAWGINIVGPISPPSSKSHRYILTIIDYFSKWSKATTLKEKKLLTWLNS